MRTIVNISMPASLKKEVDRAIQKGSYASTSEYFRHAIRALKEKELYESVMRSEKEFAHGKGKKLRSLRDLM